MPVLTDSLRSAEPPTQVGRNGAIAWIVSPEAARVASAAFAAGSNDGSASARPGSGLPAQARSHSVARAGSAARQAAKC
jgi:hypothetical protein